MSAVLVVLGALLTVAGASWWALQAGVVAAGLLLLVAGLDLRPRGDQ